MYIITGKVYDKKCQKTSDTDGNITEYFYIKITDENYIVNEWIEIPKEKYNKLENNNIVQFYVFDKTGSDYFLII